MTPSEDEWNWLEWLHHTSKDMSIHTGTSYQEAMSVLLKASHVLAEIWAEGYEACQDTGHNPIDEPQNPYSKAT